MKAAKIIFGLLWLLFAFFQINDTQQYGNHDAWFWILFYLTSAILTFSSLKLSPPPWLFPSMIGFCIGAALFRMQDAVGNFDFTAPLRATPIPSQMNATTQQPNEIDGLILVALWFGFLNWDLTRNLKKSST